MSGTRRARRLRYYVLLPAEITEYERGYLARVNRLAFVFFWLHPPQLALVALACGTSPWRALVSSALVLVGPTVAYATFSSPRHVSIVLGVTSMLMGGLLVHFGQGPMQIEMHFYFFVLLALQAVFANPTVVVASATTVALHHVILFYVLPSSVFNYDATIWTVLVHAVFVVLESVATCFVARSFFDDVIGLDRLVRERTSELDLRNRNLQLVLDHVEQGLVTIDLDGAVVGARSSAIDRWLGPCPPGAVLPEVLASHSSSFGSWLALGLSDVRDDVMPRELTLAQLPSELSVGARELRFSYTPVERDGTLERLLVVVTDVTATLAQAAAAQSDREIGMVLERNATDPTAVADFVEEADRLVCVMEDPRESIPARMRALHTLKGDGSVFGIASLAATCHEVETDILAGDRPLDEASQIVRRAWSEFRARLDPLVRGAGEGVVRIHTRELYEAATAAVAGAPSIELARRMLDWTREPIELRFRRIAEQASYLARKLGRELPDVAIQTANVRLPRRRFAPFWHALTHAVRNALDHGIEPRSERLAAGKPAQGRLGLSASTSGGIVEIRVTDDGSGIDWERVRAAAASRGLPTNDERQLEAALFVDGLSTCTQASELSGRGVGMPALRAVTHSLGGELRVESQRGRGTTLVFRIPYVEADLARELAAVEHSLSPRVAAA